MDDTIFDTYHTAHQFLYTHTIGSQSFNQILYDMHMIWPEETMALPDYEPWLISILEQYPVPKILFLLDEYYQKYSLTPLFFHYYEQRYEKKISSFIISFLYQKNPLFGLYADSHPDAPFNEAKYFYNKAGHLGRALYAYTKNEFYDLSLLLEDEYLMYSQYLLIGRDVFLMSSHVHHEEIHLVF